MSWVSRLGLLNFQSTRTRGSRPLTWPQLSQMVSTTLKVRELLAESIASSAASLTYWWALATVFCKSSSWYKESYKSVSSPGEYWSGGRQKARSLLLQDALLVPGPLHYSMQIQKAVASVIHLVICGNEPTWTISAWKVLFSTCFALLCTELALLEEKGCSQHERGDMILNGRYLYLFTGFL